LTSGSGGFIPDTLSGRFLAFTPLPYVGHCGNEVISVRKIEKRENSRSSPRGAKTAPRRERQRLHVRSGCMFMESVKFSWTRKALSGKIDDIVKSAKNVPFGTAS